MPPPSRSRSRARGRGRVGLGIFAGVAALALVAAGGLYLYLRSSLPQTSGRIVVTGPKATIRIERDADGVPTIIAQSDEDAAFGLGFVHAQDRLFQMELMRRYASGRLAEIFRQRGAADRPADAHPRALSCGSRRNSVFIDGPQPRARRLRGRGQRFSVVTPWRAAAGVPAAALFAGTVARSRQPRLGQADGAADQRQLPRRVAARLHGAIDFTRRPRLSLSRISERRADNPGGDAADLSPARTWRVVGRAA